MARAEKRQRQKEGRRARIEEEVRLHKARRRTRLTINLLILAAVLGGIAFLVSQSGTEKAEKKPAATVACGGKKPVRKDPGTFSEPPPVAIDQAKTYTATIETSCGTIVVELADDQSPQTVNSFVFLARKGFFDGLTFHRVVKGFAIQGGDPKGDGTGGSGYTIAEAAPPLAGYPKGTVAMAKSPDQPAGASGSQFFIVPGDQAEQSLNGTPEAAAQYAILGTVESGFEALERMEAVPLAASGSQGERSKPAKTIYIEKITIQET